MSQSAILALEDGSLFQGVGIGYKGQDQGFLGEVVFNTSMTGYQEILSDPSYFQQMVTLTYPHIGNVGTNASDQESTQMYASGLVIRDLPQLASNWRKEISLEEYLVHNKKMAIAQIDTRRLTRHLREKGALKGCLMWASDLKRGSPQKLVEKARSFHGLKNLDLAQHVTTQAPYEWQARASFDGHGVGARPQTLKIIAYDFGIKKSILDCLHYSGFQVTVVPAKTPAQEVLALNPNGIFLSNGPGDPEPCQYALDAIKEFFKHRIPMFGICLGHQLLALACGAKTYKMKFGHHGANHPVQELTNGRVFITSQNHGFAVQEDSLPSDLVVTHRSLFDQTIQGVAHKHLPVFGFQGHPEASPGPQEIRGLFTQFYQRVEKHAFVQEHSSV